MNVSIDTKENNLLDRVQASGNKHRNNGWWQTLASWRQNVFVQENSLDQRKENNIYVFTNFEVSQLKHFRGTRWTRDNQHVNILRGKVDNNQHDNDFQQHKIIDIKEIYHALIYGSILK